MLVDRGELDVDAPGRRLLAGVLGQGQEERAGAAPDVAHLGRLRLGPAVLDPRHVRLGRPRPSGWRCSGPWWEPGTASGYHANNQGHLVGEVIRRITGKTFKRFVAEEIAGPLGADFQVGRPRGGLGPDRARRPPAAAGRRLPHPRPRVGAGEDLHRAGRLGEGGQLTGVAAGRSRRAQRALERARRAAGAAHDVARRRGRRRAAALAEDDRPGVRPAGRRRRPRARRAVPLGHRLLPGLAGDPVRARGPHVLLGRLGRLDDRDGPRPAADDQLHDEPDGARHPRLRPRARPTSEAVYAALG